MSRWVSDNVYNNLIGIVMGIDNDNIYTLAVDTLTVMVLGTGIHWY